MANTSGLIKQNNTSTSSLDYPKVKFCSRQAANGYYKINGEEIERIIISHKINAALKGL